MEPSFKLNFVGRIVSRTVNKISPWIACFCALATQSTEALSMKHTARETTSIEASQKFCRYR
jgi:hypothetical protein